MLASAVPQVDVVTDGFDWWNAVVGGGGFFAAVVAIVLALRAQRAADTAVSDERRRVFELDILRELLKDVDESDLVEEVFRRPAALSRYDFRRQLLTVELQYWDKVVALDGSRSLIDDAGLGKEYAEASKAADETGVTLRSSSDDYRELRRRSVLDPPADVAAAAELKRQFAAMTARRSALEAAEKEAHAEMERLARAARSRLGERLAYDVKQAALSLVGTRRTTKPTWCNRYRAR